MLRPSHFGPAGIVVALAAGCGAPARAPEAGAEPSARSDWIGASDEAQSTPTPVTAALPTTAPVPLESCGNGQDGFSGWLESFRRYAVERTISPRTVAAALSGVAYDAGVVDLDRSQRQFKLSFAQFSAKHLTRARLVRARELLAQNGALFARIEVRFGVAPEILVAIWGLETDFGDNTGTRSSLASLATLSYDCRRSARFREELLSALRIVDRGDLAPEAMVGAWAGELGQTQFLPSSYEQFAVDFDGDGRADLIGSSADALASTANYLRGHGWQPGDGYKPGSPNFAALRTWNASEVYCQTIAAFASQLAAPPPRP